VIANVRAAAVAASLFALAGVPTHAQTSQGLGSVTCDRFLKAARSGDILYHQASSWLMGYASGLNAASGGTAVTLTGDQLMKSAGDYCEANPGGTLAQAAGQWHAGRPVQAAQPQQQQQQSGDRRWMLDLNKGSGYRPPK
jgi:hypothetical protein